MRILGAAIALAFISTTAVDVAHSQEKAVKAQKQRKKASGGLAGSEGDVKRKIMFLSGFQGGCEGLYRRYVAAGSHAAYAATTVDYFSEDGFVCGIGVGGASAAEAERRALAQCNAGRKDYKGVKPSGPCVIYASK